MSVLTKRRGEYKEREGKPEAEPKENHGVKDQTGVHDAGNKSEEHYRKNLPPWRFNLRQKFLPIVRWETEVLASMQKKVRTPWLDYYFAWSANLASHTFYVLCLPMFEWFGSSKIPRDLVYVLGLGIYVLGNLKDCMCLPRPRSPPLHRITMSEYTAQEYGFPSSHSANATAVTLICLWRLLEVKEQLTSSVLVCTLAFLILYYVSLIFGRLYCGMHGFIDVFAGTAIGVGLFLFRFLVGQKFDQWLLVPQDSSWWGLVLTPIFIIGGNLLLIHTHFEPVDDCPCFDDTVAFVGVLIGLDLSHWVACITGVVGRTNNFEDPMRINYDYNELGSLKTIARVIVGVTLIVTWKAIAKPIVFTLLPPIYKFVGVYVPRRSFKSTAFTKESLSRIRSQSISNIDVQQVGDINGLIKLVTSTQNSIDSVGPVNDIDYYEMLDYKNKHPEEPDSAIDMGPPTNSVFKPRYDVETVGRLIIYAGVATCTFWGFFYATQSLGLAC
ncbi:uncharacterized protein KQ657_003330 [Scheffersomyces spartinae]|uniref:Phosphatidic acid phosphatase type 2/haloperoxidase domain-containing protein n=1 Tax=Scheffersomyces spartinae TaxID=45513 RepID=A0A9P7VDM1_9ASCO|nr:uncharacterized protein KQ657_003330 [Scheffersomyces spartinae]KAG7195563.1 hypothetical protein KQ657_003330 [Scheffersomyces spartinae]